MQPLEWWKAPLVLMNTVIKNHMMNAIFIWTRRLCCSLLLKQWISSKKKQKTGSLVFTNKRLLQIHPNFKEITQSLVYLKTLCSSRSTSTTVQDKQDFDFCQTWLLEFRPGSLCEVVLGHSVIKSLGDRLLPFRQLLPLLLQRTWPRPFSPGHWVRRDVQFR